MSSFKIAGLNKKVLFVIFSFCLFIYNKAQTWVWDTVIYANGNIHLTLDKAGNVWTFTNDNPVVRRYTNTGAYVGSLNLSIGMSISNMVASPDSFIYVTGIYTNTLNLQSLSIHSHGGYDVFLAKFKQDGSLVWLKGFGSKLNDNAGDICMNGFDIVVTGMLADTTIFDTQIVPKQKVSDLYIAKFSSSGILTQILVAAGLPNTWSNGEELEIDPQGNLFCLADISGDLHVGSGMIQNYGRILIKVSSNLSYLWNVTLSSGSFQYAYNLRLNSAGKIYYTFSQGCHYCNGIADIKSLLSNGNPDCAFLSANTASQYFEIDACDNLHFVNTERRLHLYNGPDVHTIRTGIIDSYCQLMNEVQTDSSYSSRMATDILIIDDKHDFIAGFFNGQIEFKNILNAGNSYYFNAIIEDLNSPVNVTPATFLKVCEESRTELTARHPGTIKWYSNPSDTTPVATGSSYVTPPLSAGVYTWYATADLCASAMVAITVTVSACTGLSDFTKTKVQVYPNPATNYVTIEAENGCQLKIFNSVGEMVMDKTISKGRNSVPVSLFSGGVYFMEFSSGNERKTEKLIVW